MKYNPSKRSPKGARHYVVPGTGAVAKGLGPLLKPKVDTGAWLTGSRRGMRPTAAKPKKPLLPLRSLAWDRFHKQTVEVITAKRWWDQEPGEIRGEWVDSYLVQAPGKKPYDQDGVFLSAVPVKALSQPEHRRQQDRATGRKSNLRWSKVDAERALVRAEIYIQEGEWKAASEALSIAWEAARAAYPAKWAQDMLGESIAHMRATLARKRNPVSRGVKLPKPSPEQAKALRAILAGGGKVERWPGGFWTSPGTRVIRRTAAGPHYKAADVPEWSTTVQTVQTMEKRGWLRRTGKFKDEWQDTREVTPEGVAALGRAR